MSSLTRIVCLANSRKHGARCIAGIDPDTGAWIRPVSGLDDGRVERLARMVDGREPVPGDVVEIPLAPGGPDFGFERENRAILPGPWRIVSSWSVEQIRSLVSPATTILHNDDNYVNLEYLRSLPPDRRATLQLVEVSDLSVFSAGPSVNGGRKWKAAFTSPSGSGLACMITDPALMDKLEIGYVPPRRAVLTVSLSMPFRPSDWEKEGTPCWKLVAAIVELEPGTEPLMPATLPGFAGFNAAAPRSRAHIDDLQVHEALANIFGFHAFRPGQDGVVRAILDGRDAFAVMPTGGGKSLCYQLPACLLPGTCMVVSPLISLMKDQVDAARANGIRAAFLNSALADRERVDVLRLLTAGELDLIYVSPERFAMDQFLAVLGRVRLNFFAIDEAHCISEWGHDFRPDYLLLADLVKRFPHVPVAAFTATATTRVQADIIARLGLRDPHVLRASFDRPNLFYEVLPKTDDDDQILDFIRQRPGRAGIVYRMTRKSVDQTCEMLRTSGIRSLPYHAGMDDAARAANQEAFRRDEVDVIVATIAFGMGIDKSNVRYVVHGDLPKNIESYFQETGRAGRDGEPAHCLLLYSPGDIPRIRFFIDKVEDDGERRRLRRALEEMASYAGAGTCRRARLLAYFGETYPATSCGACDQCGRQGPETAVTSEARTVLDAIRLCGERFGAGHIVDIVTGAKTARVREWKHDRLPVYAAGAARSKRFWRALVDDLVAQGLIGRSDGEYPVLTLGAGAREVLAGTRDVKVRRSLEEVPRSAPERPADAAANAELFERLRTLRLLVARERNVPAFVVFSDRSIREMAERVPLTPAELLEVTGVGEVKLAQFGARFLRAISEYAAEFPDRVPSRRAGARVDREIKRPPRTEGPSETVETTWEFLRQGLSIPQIAEARQLSPATIVGHVEALLLEGRHVDIDQCVAAAKREEIAQLFGTLGTEYLGPVVKASGGAFGYEEARLTRAWMTAQADRG